tara:strand:+ start:1297 stop:2364 length:1068 start_codon:yes stop_codon:yes gene_type:complete
MSKNPTGNNQFGNEASGCQQSLVGRSAPMQALRQQIKELSRRSFAVVLVGEPGTGKELVARMLHQQSGRASRPFVVVDIADIPQRLIDATLFGHKAESTLLPHLSSEGRFFQARGGTLYLNGISNLPLHAQERFLRVLNGDAGARRIKVKPRIIVSTNHNLRRSVDSGSFREDLFNRVCSLPVYVPSLRDHISDLDSLIDFFAKFSLSEKRPSVRFDQSAMEILRSYEWPGNVDELITIIDRCSTFYPNSTVQGETIKIQLTCSAKDHAEPKPPHSLSEAVEHHLSRYFSLHGSALPPDGLHTRVLREIERPLITLSLSATGGNQQKTARLLGINRNTLRKKIREMDITTFRLRR